MGVSSQVMTLRVAVVTSSRADWSHLRRPVAAFHDHSELEPILVATAAMVDHDYGSAIAEVEAEGYEVPHRIPCLGGDRDVDMAASGGRAQLVVQSLRNSGPTWLWSRPIVLKCRCPPSPP